MPTTELSPVQIALWEASDPQFPMGMSELASTAPPTSPGTPAPYPRRETEVFKYLPPKTLDRIVDGSQNHVFLRYELGDGVTRLWLYDKRKEAIEYVMETGPPQMPGQMGGIPGVGNDEFNKGQMGHARFAFPVKKLWGLGEIVTLEQIQLFGIENDPTRWRYAPEALCQARPCEAMKRVH